MIRSLSTIIQTVESNPPSISRLIKTGIPTLDRDYFGIGIKEIWILAAYTGSGKTFLSLNFALNAAKAGKKVVYFSLEMASEALAYRLWGILSNIESTKLEYSELLTMEEKIKKEEIKPDIEKLSERIHIIDSAYSLSQIEGTIKDLERTDFKPDLVIVDFVQNIKGRGSLYERISEASVDFQKMAKEHDFSMIICSQISNEEQRAGADSRVIGTKGAGEIAAVADFVLWLDKPKGYSANNIVSRDLSLRKVRRGSNNKIDLLFHFPGGKVTEQSNQFKDL